MNPNPLAIPMYLNFREAYSHLADAVLDHGAKAAPRGQATRELLSVGFGLWDMTDTLATGVNRSLAVKFAASDAIQVIGGFADHEWAGAYSKKIGNYGTHGAYGPRIAGQMEQAIQRLRFDPSTRRSVVQVWDPELDLFYEEGASDYPCTTEFQFMIRDNALDIHVRMRANDIFLGLPYDVFTFSQVALTVANIMDIAPGRYFHHVTSFHAYEKHVDKLADLYRAGPDPLHQPTGLGVRGQKWSDITQLAREISYQRGDLDPLRLRLTDSEKWYADQLAINPT